MKTSKWLLPLVTAIVASGATVTTAFAEDTDKTQTLTGTMVCAKCKLHETEKCQNVLQVDQDGKTVNYYLSQNKVSKDFHDEICKNDGEKVTVTGTVKEKKGKEMLTADKIEAVK